MRGLVAGGEDVSSLRPAANVCTTLTTAASTVSGYACSDSSVTVPGNVTLDGAIVFVNGDLTIHGSLKGVGMLAATGSINLLGPVDLDTSSGQRGAILAGGSITLH